jgi:hypothetical protein
VWPLQHIWFSNTFFFSFSTFTHMSWPSSHDAEGDNNFSWYCKWDLWPLQHIWFSNTFFFFQYIHIYVMQNSHLCITAPWWWILRCDSMTVGCWNRCWLCWYNCGPEGVEDWYRFEISHQLSVVESII